MAQSLDAIALRILAFLEQDGRVPASQIAPRLKLVPLINGQIGAIPGVVRARTIVIPCKVNEVCDWHAPARVAEEGAAME